MGKLVIAHLRRRMANYIAVCVELIVLLVVGNVLMNQLIPFMQSEQLYDKLGLSKVLCSTIKEEGSAEALAEVHGARVICRNYRGQSVETEKELLIQPVEKEYLQRFQLLSEEDMGEGAIAVVPASLSSEYTVGETYTMAVNEEIGEITFTVLASIKNDLMFIPPSGDAAISIIGKYPNTILVAFDETDLCRFGATDIYTLDVKESDAQRIADALSWNEQVLAVMSCEEAREYNNSLELSQLGLPMIISVVALVLCLAGILSNTLLSIVENERNNGIYYICGYTWRQCAGVQIVSDLLAVVVSVLGAAVVILLWSESTGYVKLQGDSFGASAAVVVGIYVLAEILGIFQIKKKNVAEIAERMK